MEGSKRTGRILYLTKKILTYAFSQVSVSCCFFKTSSKKKKYLMLQYSLLGLDHLSKWNNNLGSPAAA